MEFFGNFSRMTIIPMRKLDDHGILMKFQKNDKFQSEYQMTMEFFNKNSSLKSQRIDDPGILILYHC